MTSVALPSGGVTPTKRNIMIQNNPPFKIDYVMGLTLKNIRQAVDFSTRKTMFRLKDFTDDPDKHAEIMLTLSALSALHKIVDEFEQNNPDIFKKEEQE